MSDKLTAQQRQFKTYLAQQPHATLVDLLLEVALRDDRLAQSLLVKSALPGAQDTLVDELRQVIDDATYVDGFVDWRSGHSFADPLDQAVDTLAELLTPQRAAALVGLAQYAIEQTEEGLENIDDSNGLVGDVLCRLGDLHLKACELARPDAATLAENLFHLETTLPFGVCSFSALRYRHVLGEKGLLQYRALAQAQWDALGSADPKGGFNHNRYKITRVMEQLAEASRDVDELVRIKSRDLTGAYGYFVIAEILQKNQRVDEALEWAEQGIKNYPDRPDNRLRDFVVAAYLQRKRPAEALHLTWIQFEEQPGLAHYQKLQALASKLGAWPAQRERALTLLEDVIAREAAQPSRYKTKPSVPDTSRRLAIALWENDLDAAWAALHNGDCQQGLRISLAQALEATRPSDAVLLYRQLVPAIVGQTNNEAYARALVLIRAVKQLMTGLGQNSQWLDYLAELRTAFKPKRNFIKLLEKV